MAPPSVRKIAVGAGLGLAGTYAYTAGKFRRETSTGLDLAEPPPPGSPDFARLVEVVTGSPLRSGNRVRLLRNGDETFPAMLEAIASARLTVDFSSYIYWPGEITETFTEAFIDRARAGVEVNMILDAYGSAKLDRAHVERLRSGGVHVAFFRPPRWYDVGKANNRMHRRLLIVDGKVGFAGGVGIADVWTGHAQDPSHWRETHARLEGPAVRDVLGGFAENWTDATHRVVNGVHVPHLRRFRDGAKVHITRSTPATAVTGAAALFHATIAAARERLWLTTAYFTAGRGFTDPLCEAARRGVDVRILTNGPNVDKEVVRRTGQRAFTPLLESGVRIFEYQQTMLHAKTVVVDEAWGHLGSNNFDHRSFALDAELVVSLQDTGLVTELAQHFLDDLDVSEELDLAAWKRRPLSERAVEFAGEFARQSF